MSKFTDPLLVTPLPDGKKWVVVGDFGYDVGRLGSNISIKVEKGFVTDFASVPRPFWWVLPKWGVYGNAAIIHDWLYWEKIYQKKNVFWEPGQEINITRAQADYVFFEAMSVLKVPSIKKRLIYYAVRVFGIIAWKNNEKLKRESKTKCVSNKQTVDIFTVSIPNRSLFMRTIKQFFLNSQT